MKHSVTPHGLLFINCLRQYICKYGTDILTSWSRATNSTSDLASPRPSSSNRGEKGRKQAFHKFCLTDHMCVHDMNNGHVSPSFSGRTENKKNYLVYIQLTFYLSAICFVFLVKFKFIKDPQMSGLNVQILLAMRTGNAPVIPLCLYPDIPSSLPPRQPM